MMFEFELVRGGVVVITTPQGPMRPLPGLRYVDPHGCTVALLVEPKPLSIARLEWEHIQKVLGECQGNISETARRLGMHRRTLQRKLAKRPARR